MKENSLMRRSATGAARQARVGGIPRALFGHAMISTAALPNELERHTSIQYAVSTALANSETSVEAASAVLAQLGPHLNWDFGSCWLVDSSASALRIVATWPERATAGPFRELTHSTHFARGEGLPGRVWQSESVEWIADVSTGLGVSRVQPARLEGIHGTVAFPLFAGSTVVGVIEFFSRSLRQPDIPTQELLANLGRRIGEFIARKQSMEERHSRELAERQRLEESRRLLLEGSMTLTSSLDYKQTLHNLSTVVIPSFADWYAADVVEPDGTLRRIETVHRDPKKVELANELTRRYPPRPNDGRGIDEIVRTGKSLMISNLSDDMLVGYAVDNEHLRIIRALGLRSYLVVPMRARGGVMGALTLVTAESGRHYDEQDRIIGEELGRQAGQAIENSRLFSALAEQRELLEQQALELESQAAELKETTDELESTVRELKSTNEQLERRSDEANEANRAKSTFLAAMSHELRTPLNAIIGYAQLLEIGVHGSLEEKQREDLQRISRSGQHLLGLINDILNYAKVEAGRVEYDIEPVPVRPILIRVEEMIAPQARAKSIDYSVQDDCPNERACADPEKLTQIIVNLLSNAVRFTEPGGGIRVRCSHDADRMTIEVIDSGIGIPADKLRAIFEPFVQVNQEYTSQRQGTGLGLAISRDLARGMGGDLTVQSAVGRGSTFTLTLSAEKKVR
jgi:signal transduction histidine kinase/putative methionine-R-sulfoxide reductase with GAF domain